MALTPTEIREYLEAVGCSRDMIENMDGLALVNLYMCLKRFVNAPTETCPRCKENCYSVNNKGFCGNCRFDISRERLEREAIGGIHA